MIRITILICGLLTLCQCRLTHSIDRTDPTAWNESGTWKLFPGTKSDYVPTEYRSKPSVANQEGEWIYDIQGDARFYIPRNGTKHYSAEVLRAEAYKSSNHFTHSAQSYHNVAQVLMTPIHVATMGAFLWDLHGGGDAGSTDLSTPDAGASSSSNSHCDHNSGSSSCSSGGGHSK